MSDSFTKEQYEKMAKAIRDSKTKPNGLGKLEISGAPIIYDMIDKLDMKLNDWFVSVSEFAKANNVTPQAVRKAIVEGRLIASKVGKQWVVAKRQKLKGI